MKRLRAHLQAKASLSLTAGTINTNRPQTEDQQPQNGTCTAECLLYGYKEPQFSTSQAVGLEVELRDQSIQAGKLYTRINDWQTRILVLKSGPADTPLEADLHVADLIYDTGVVLHELQRKVEYEALSYCWGSPNFNRILKCNGTAYPITENLFNALQRLRRTTEPDRYLWVDAICINQHDSWERSFQVGNMLAIFQKAQQVSVWLGEHGRHTLTALHCLTLCHRERVSSTLEKICSQHFAIVVSGLYDLLDRPWYSRIWVKQEMWAAKHVKIRFAGISMPWNTLADVATFLDSLAKGRKDACTTPLPKPLRHHLDSLRRASVKTQFLAGQGGVVPLDQIPYVEMRGFKGRFPEETLECIKTELAEILQSSSYSEYSDPRDRVYAILGMTTAYRAFTTKVSSPRTDLHINYGKSAAQVYSDVVRYYVERDKNLAILCLPICYGQDVHGQRLPTWCPNWSVPFETSRRRFGEFHDSPPYEAPPIAIPWHVLQLTGFKLGRIVKCKKQFKELDRIRTVVRLKCDISRVEQFSVLKLELYTMATWGIPAHIGDILAMAKGSIWPLVLRHAAQNGEYEFVGILDWKKAGYENFNLMKEDLEALFAFAQKKGAIETLDLV